jgi:hypothetical protein
MDTYLELGQVGRCRLGWSLAILEDLNQNTIILPYCGVQSCLWKASLNKPRTHTQTLWLGRLHNSVICWSAVSILAVVMWTNEKGFYAVSMLALSGCERPTKAEIWQLWSVLSQWKSAARVTTIPLRNLDPLSFYFHSPPPVCRGCSFNTRNWFSGQEKFINISCRISEMTNIYTHWILFIPCSNTDIVNIIFTNNFSTHLLVYHTRFSHQVAILSGSKKLIIWFTIGNTMCVIIQ